jgi:aminoglycoside phosphotransferase family enzyme/predicted kinase
MDDSLPVMIRALQNPALYDHEVKNFNIIETHISWVLLTGHFAYKIKKPVDLGFLDFSTLEKRHYYCEEELRLNRRLAPDLYLQVVTITGEPAIPEINGSGRIIDYAVKMVQFPADARLDRVLAKDLLSPTDIDLIAEEIACFHAQTEIAGSDSPYGTPEVLFQPVLENFRQIRPLLSDPSDLQRLDEIANWSETQHKSLRQIFIERKKNNFIRECHGDLHLENIAKIAGQIVVFDCIEFNEKLRWIDVGSEIAFLTMDLEDRGVPHFAYRVINKYLELSGDYGLLRVLRFYKVYRAMVRAKVARIRLGQESQANPDREALLTAYNGYIALAQQYCRLPKPMLIINHGLSGSGKTTFSAMILEQFRAIRVRSDIERKRLFDLVPTQSSSSELDQGIYTKDATKETYQRLAQLAEIIVKAGYTVIVDATFLKQSQRKVFQDLAVHLKVPFAILDCVAPIEVLQNRITQRQQQGHDVSEANHKVLENQIENQEPLSSDEQNYAITVNATQPLDMEKLINELKRKRQFVA